MNLLTDLILLLKFIFLGFVQGVTEPIPISSSGHLVILRDMFHLDTPGLSFEIIVHFGSLIAIFIVYRNDLSRLLIDSCKFLLKREKTYYASFKFSIHLLLATLITGGIGLFLERFISEELTKPVFIAVSLIITGFFLWKIRHLHGEKTEKDITMKDAIIIGIAQSIALIPGISRSGATVVAAMLLGMKRVTALRFSFLLFIPVSIGINLLSIKDMIRDPEISVLAIPYTLAFITSIIATYFALKWFISIMVSGKLKYFAYYCFLLGAIILCYQLI